MGIGVDQARRAASFLEAYGNTAEQELARAIGPMPSPDADTKNQPFLREPDDYYAAAADAASAFREAAQWWLYIDPMRARASLSRSGRLFHAIGQPFGLFLRTVAEDVDIETLDRAFRPALRTLGSRRSLDERSSFWAPAVQYPQQQVYLLLAGCARVEALEDLTPEIFEILEASPHRDGATPIGALGTPIRRLWDVARHLHRRESDAPLNIARHLAAMCRQYEEIMTLATVNSYLWRNGAAPVDVGDIDISGVTAMAARVFGPDILEAAVHEFIDPYQDNLIQVDSQGRLALAPFEAGLEFAQSVES
jgi:hypothetical protein